MNMKAGLLVMVFCITPTSSPAPSTPLSPNRAAKSALCGSVGCSSPFISSQSQIALFQDEIRPGQTPFDGHHLLALSGDQIIVRSSPSTALRPPAIGIGQTQSGRVEPGPAGLIDLKGEIEPGQYLGHGLVGPQAQHGQHGQVDHLPPAGRADVPMATAPGRRQRGPGQVAQPAMAVTAVGAAAERTRGKGTQLGRTVGVIEI